MIMLEQFESPVANHSRVLGHHMRRTCGNELWICELRNYRGDFEERLFWITMSCLNSRCIYRQIWGKVFWLSSRKELVYE